MNRNSKGSFANIKEAQAALRESIQKARSLADESERMLSERSKQHNSKVKSRPTSA